MKSMTAFGRATATEGELEITVELRSVNNRYIDWNLRLPKAFSALEEKIKAEVTSGGISRGKIDLSLTYSRSKNAEGPAVKYEADIPCAASYMEAADQLTKELQIANDLTVSKLLTLPGVLVPIQEDSITDTDEEERKWAVISPIVREATAQFLLARKSEGDRITADISSKLNGIRRMTATVAARSDDNIRSYRARFEERLKNALADNRITLDESRILTECAIYADKAAIDEELVRLASHFEALDGLLKAQEPVGRRIDFLLQEINREVNTIGSKCVDAEIAQTVVNIKSELEKIREQIQNIE